MPILRQGRETRIGLLRRAAVAALSTGMAVSGLAVGLVAALPSPTAAAAAALGSVTTGNLGGCTTTTGTIVYVDFSAWPSGPEVGAQDIGCAPTPGWTTTKGKTTTDYEALNAAGYTTDGDEHDGRPSFCRIGVATLGDSSQEPRSSQTDEACVVTPPGQRLLVLLAGQRRLGHVVLQQLQRPGYYPAAGSIDAWTFRGSDGTNGQPTLTPDLVRAAEGTAAITAPLAIGPTQLPVITPGKA